MIGLGTIINVLAIIVGGILGLFFGKLLKKEAQDTLTVTCGIATIFVGISGAMEGMLTAEGSKIASGKGMFVVVCLVLGAIVGELLNIEGGLERFGTFLREKTGNSKDATFVNAFLVATFTVSIGAMAIVGSIQDGISHDYSILITKSILDFIIIFVMAGAIGKGAIFSFVPVGILQGSVTLLSRLLIPVMTDSALASLSMIGSILIFCVGINLVFGKKVKVANLLPAIIFAVAGSFL